MALQALLAALDAKQHAPGTPVGVYHTCCCSQRTVPLLLADMQGGACYIGGGTVTFDSVTFTSNEAVCYTWLWVWFVAYHRGVTGSMLEACKQ